MGSFSVSAATVVTDEAGRVLLIRRADNGQWQIPGGVVELGEQPTDTAIRETHEETGITVGELQLSGCYTNVVRGIVALVFRAQVVGGSPRCSDESVAVEFVEPDEALERVPGIFRPRISDALAGSSVVFRGHDGISLVETPL